MSTTPLNPNSKFKPNDTVKYLHGDHSYRILNTDNELYFVEYIGKDIGKGSRFYVDLKYLEANYGL